LETRKRITLKELTRLTGFSRTTIYNVLNNKGNFSEKTKEEIFRAMEQYGYHPNLNARNLAKSQPIEIGFIGIRHNKLLHFERQVREGIDWAMKQYEDDGLQVKLLFLAVDDTVSDREEEWIKKVEMLEAAGVHNFVMMVPYGEKSQTKLKELVQKGCKLVLMESGHLLEEVLCSVGCDYRQSGRLCAELVQKMMPSGGALQPILYADFDKPYIYTTRYLGFREVIEKNPQFQINEPIYMSHDDSMEVLHERINARKIDAWVDMIHMLPQLAGELHYHLDQMPLLFGFDYYRELRPLFEDGKIDAVINQSITENIKLGVQVLFEYLCYGKNPPQKQLSTPLTVIMAENCAYYDC